MKAGEIVVLNPGESITLPSRLYHEFWGEGSRVLVGEVSLVNDDRTDNRFYEAVGRFPEIEEDEPPLHLLVPDYANAFVFISDFIRLESQSSPSLTVARSPGGLKSELPPPLPRSSSTM